MITKHVVPVWNVWKEKKKKSQHLIILLAVKLYKMNDEKEIPFGVSVSHTWLISLTQQIWGKAAHLSLSVRFYWWQLETDVQMFACVNDEYGKLTGKLVSNRGIQQNGRISYSARVQSSWNVLLVCLNDPFLIRGNRRWRENITPAALVLFWTW